MTSHVGKGNKVLAPEALVVSWNEAEHWLEGATALEDPRDRRH